MSFIHRGAECLAKPRKTLRFSTLLGWTAVPTCEAHRLPKKFAGFIGGTAGSQGRPQQKRSLAITSSAPSRLPEDGYCSDNCKKACECPVADAGREGILGSAARLARRSIRYKRVSRSAGARRVPVHPSFGLSGSGMWPLVEIDSRKCQFADVISPIAASARAAR